MQERKRNSGAKIGWLTLAGFACAAIAVVASTLWWPGTNSADRQGVKASDEPGTAGLTPEGILRSTIRAYGKTSIYRDLGEIRLKYRVGDQWAEEAMELAIALHRPNLLRLDLIRGVSQVTLACDGTVVRCQIRDPEMDNFDQQIVERPAPAELSLPLVFSATEFLDPSSPQELLSAMMGLPVRIELTPLGLLLDQEPLEQLIKAASQRIRLKDETLDGKAHYRVQLVVPAGELVFWIDPRTHFLRRVEYPTTGLFSPEVEQNEQLAASLVADFTRVSVAAAEDHRFRLDRPSGAKVLRHFVLPPTTKPAPILGQHVGEFAFTGLDNQRVAADDLNQRLAVLLWFQNHPASRAALDELHTVQEKFQNDQRLVFRAICTEPTTSMSHQRVQSLAQSWAVEIPVVRDLDAHGRDIFGIAKAPTLVVVAPNGIVQLVEEGADSEMSEQLPPLLERLLAGEDVAATFLRFVEQQRRDYQTHLTAASVDTPVTDIELPQTQIADRSQPQHLRLTPLWTCRQLTAPGNVQIAPDNVGPPSIHVVDGWRQVARIRSDGSIAQRHELPIPDDGAIRFLRAGVDRSGHPYYVGTARLARQLYVFDQAWQLALSYPEPTQKHAGIQDTQLVDLDNDGSLELYVAFAGVLGVQRVDLQGKRQWGNRTVHSTLSLEVSPSQTSPPRLLATSYLGQIVPIDAAGQDGRAIAVGSRAIHHLVAGGGSTDRPTMFCGISHTADGKRMAVGMDESLREVWSYGLPAGVFRSQLQYVDAGRLLDGPGHQWVMVGPDASIHIVADDGDFHDTFGYGEEITGMAVAELAQGPALVIATRQAVSAWKVDRRGAETNP